jgi:endonuclease/exonuclease/phosphatase family metal-dependent hydrolase
MKCVKNVAKVIDENAPYDFVLLQEASNYKKIIAESKYLQSMKFVVHKSGPENMITFWDDTKYELDSKLVGEFSKGRPWQALSFNGNLTIVNIHGEHQRVEILVKKLNKLMDILSANNPSDRFIIGGDFNNDVELTMDLAGITFYSSLKSIATCCAPLNIKLNFDHVLDSIAPPKKIFSPIVNKLTSDHLPIIAILELEQTGGNIDYHRKYLKYKRLYLKMKNNS